MHDRELRYLEDTWAILVDYDGMKNVDGLKSLIDEVQERIRKVLHGEVTEQDV